MANNAILICVEDSQVKTKFCSEAQANQAICGAAEQGFTATAFICENETLDQQTLMSISPDLKERVAQAERKVANDLALKLALDRRGVPADVPLRRSIALAIKDWQEGTARA